MCEKQTIHRPFSLNPFDVVIFDAGNTAVAVALVRTVEAAPFRMSSSSERRPPRTRDDAPGLRKFAIWRYSIRQLRKARLSAT